MAKLGDWRWYCGSDTDDDEMMDCGTREQAISDGRRQYAKGESFYIIEARMREADEKAMARGRIDTAPFAETRNGEWIKA
jgi:hypothetical protein